MTPALRVVQVPRIKIEGSKAWPKNPNWPKGLPSAPPNGSTLCAYPNSKPWFGLSKDLHF